MKIIVESGASKSDWRLIGKDGREKRKLLAGGMNVSTMQMKGISEIIHEAGQILTDAAESKISSVHFYTAGVITDDIRSDLSSVLSSVFPDAEIEIQNDLTAAARAACGHNPGIVAIIGTGSNSCQYDGKEIVKRVYSSGYILGDEGSAATLGKLFIADFLKGLVPEHISREFSSRYDSSYATIVENVYRSGSSPSGYLGSFAPFIMEHYSDSYIKSLVDRNFRDFFRRSIKQYDYEDCPVGIVGGFGFALRDIILSVAEEEGVKISGFMQCPIEGLIRYHADSQARSE
jgi:N-acetylglucosamine kinase-like BadF-type ATPase